MKSHPPSFHIGLHSKNKGIGAVHYFSCSTDNTFEIEMPFPEHSYALIINLSEASENYRLNGMMRKLPNGSFNFYSIQPGTLRWKMQEGVNSFMVVNCTDRFLNIYRETSKALTPFLDGKRQVGRTMNRRPHVASPSMMDGVDRLFSTFDSKGPLHEMKLECIAGELIIDAIRCTSMHELKIINDDIMLEISRVYSHLLFNVEDVRDARQLVDQSSLPAEDFHRFFELVYHRTVEETLNRERMKIAVDLLQFTSADVFDVSVQSGFPSFDEFTHAFKESYNMDPYTFRLHNGIHPDC